MRYCRNLSRSPKKFAKPGTAAELEVAKAANARAQQEVDALSRALAQAQNEFANAGARHAGLVARHASALEELASLDRVAEENGLVIGHALVNDKHAFVGKRHPHVFSVAPGITPE